MLEPAAQGKDTKQGIVSAQFTVFLKGQAVQMSASRHQAEMQL